MNAKVHRACHALSLEDERDAFRPVIWDERYVRGTAVVPGQDKQNWLFEIDYDPRDDAAKAADPAPHLRTNLPPDRPGTDQSGVVRRRSYRYRRRLSAERPVLCHARLDARSRRGLRPEILGLSASTHLSIRRSIRTTSSTTRARGLLATIATSHATKGVLRGAALQAVCSGRYCRDLAVVAQVRRIRRQEFSPTCIRALAQSVLPPPQVTMHEFGIQADSSRHRSLRAGGHADPLQIHRQGWHGDRCAHPSSIPVARDRRCRTTSGTGSGCAAWSISSRCLPRCSSSASPFFVIYFPGFGFSSVGPFVIRWSMPRRRFCPGFSNPGSSLSAMRRVSCWPA